MNQKPSIVVRSARSVALTGRWRIADLAEAGLGQQLSSQLRTLESPEALEWDLREVSDLDHIAAQLIWNAWRRQWPADCKLNDAQRQIFETLIRFGSAASAKIDRPGFRLIELWHGWNHRMHEIVLHLAALTTMLGQTLLDIAQFARKPARGPWKEISANIYHIGFQALSVTALVGFLIGVVLSYLSAQQLHTFGGDIYLVNILGMSIIRELGPMLAAILVAGRSGSAITAQLGVMRVTEELDAMLVMGLPHGFRLIMPRVLALALAMPLLVIWTDAMALCGGMMAANLQLGLSPTYFLHRLPDAVPLANYWIGLGKGACFGMLIALIACHFGLRIEPNTESLGRGTTNSVVSAITVVILADAVFAIVFSHVGYY